MNYCTSLAEEIPGLGDEKRGKVKTCEFVRILTYNTTKGETLLQLSRVHPMLFLIGEMPSLHRTLGRRFEYYSFCNLLINGTCIVSDTYPQEVLHYTLMTIRDWYGRNINNEGIEVIGHITKEGAVSICIKIR